MAEYICREAIIDDLEKEIEVCDVALDEDVWINKGLRIAIRDIKDIKTADVQPVKHGKWRRIGRSRECTVCGESCICNGDWSVLSAYCPTCGAKMDLE